MFYPAYCIEAGPIPLFPTFAHSLKSKRETIHYDETPEKVPDRAMHAHRSNCIPALHTYTITSSHCTKARKKQEKKKQHKMHSHKFKINDFIYLNRNGVWQLHRRWQQWNAMRTFILFTFLVLWYSCEKRWMSVHITDWTADGRETNWRCCNRH